MGAVSLLAEGLLSRRVMTREAIEYFVGRLHKETPPPSALVRDIIELSRLQSTDVIARGGPVSVPSLVADAVDRSHIVAEEKDIQISTRIGRRSPRCTVTLSYSVLLCRTWWRTRCVIRRSMQRWIFGCTVWLISCWLEVYDQGGYSGGRAEAYF